MIAFFILFDILFAIDIALSPLPFSTSMAMLLNFIGSILNLEFLAISLAEFVLELNTILRKSFILIVYCFVS